MAKLEETRMAGFTPVPACWVCGGDRFAKVFSAPLELSIYAQQDPELAAYSGTSVWLQKCAACGFMQPETLPSLPGYFDRMYDTRWDAAWIANEFDATYRDAIFARVLRDLARRLPSRGRLLDVGAHVGRFVHLADRAGWQAEGVELNPRTAASAAQRTGRPIHQSNAHELASRGERYAAVTLLDVLEHIPEPGRVLGALHGLLESGGWLAVKVPCGRSQLAKERVRQLLRPGYRINLANNLVHVNHFTPSTLRRVLERAGFSDVAVAVGVPEFPPQGWLGRQLRRATYHLGRLLPGGLHTPLALNLQAYARRPA